MTGKTFQIPATDFQVGGGVSFFGGRVVGKLSLSLFIFISLFRTRVSNQ